MSEKKGYKCEICGKTIITENDTIPSCCQATMTQVPLDICLQPSHAENARPMNDEDACDDFRSG